MKLIGILIYVSYTICESDVTHCIETSHVTILTRHKIVERGRIDVVKVATLYFCARIVGCVMAPDQILNVDKSRHFIVFNSSKLCAKKDICTIT